MTDVAQVLPCERTVDLDHLLSESASCAVAAPFEASRQNFVIDFARRLGRAAARYPQVRALAYWMRRAEIRRLETALAGLGGTNLLVRPRGTVFHIPPANVDTLFVYSWVLSLLAGNRNIVRLPSEATEQTTMILRVLEESLADHPDVASTTVMLRYGHDDAVTETISQACDVRVIWGGDQTVSRIRSVPLPPHATELTFADRVSIASVRASAFCELAGDDRTRLVEAFYRDTFTFDQMGCSSPRLLIWIGDSQTASADFRKRLRKVIDADAYRVPPAVAVAKLREAYASAISGEATAVDVSGGTLTMLTVPRYPDMTAGFVGGGMIYEMTVDRLSDVSVAIDGKVQTLSTFGLTRDELVDFVGGLKDRGIDRVVPIGEALKFNRYWDGYDLMSEFTRRVAIDVRAGL